MHWHVGVTGSTQAVWQAALRHCVADSTQAALRHFGRQHSGIVADSTQAALRHFGRQHSGIVTRHGIAWQGRQVAMA
eukprot:scaffold83340_cov55-Attheya_sp.AAC.3